MDFHLDTWLNLPQVTVFTCQQQEGFILLKLELLNEGINCPHCQTYTDNLHQTRPILVRDLSICGQEVYLQVPRRQFICPDCGKYPTESLEFLDKGRNYITVIDRFHVMKLVNKSLNQLRLKVGLNRTTNGMMEGLNNKIKLILRQSYGFKNFDLMREKLLACLF